MKKETKSKAGRKALPPGEKAIGLSIYLPEGLIQKLGGKDDVRFAISMFAVLAEARYPLATACWEEIMEQRKNGVWRPTLPSKDWPINKMS